MRHGSWVSEDCTLHFRNGVMALHAVHGWIKRLHVTFQNCGQRAWMWHICSCDVLAHLLVKQPTPAFTAFTVAFAAFYTRKEHECGTSLCDVPAHLLVKQPKHTSIYCLHRCIRYFLCTRFFTWLQVTFKMLCACWGGSFVSRSARPSTQASVLVRLVSFDSSACLLVCCHYTYVVLVGDYASYSM